MELFFDTYEAGVDVRAATPRRSSRLLDKEPQTKAPPVLLFSMGRLQFRCVLVDAEQRFTMFLRDGTPVRSTLSVRLQEFVRGRRRDPPRPVLRVADRLGRGDGGRAPRPLAGHGGVGPRGDAGGHA